MKMSVWSLSCQQSEFQCYHNEKHLPEFYPQDGGESQLASKLHHWHPVYFWPFAHCELKKEPNIFYRATLCLVLVRLSMTLRTLSDPNHPTAPLSFTLSGNELMQVVHTHVPLSPNRINRAGEKDSDSCGREGNRRSGVAVAMHHRLQWFIHLRAHGLGKGDEHPTYTRLSGMTPYPYYSALRS